MIDGMIVPSVVKGAHHAVSRFLLMNNEDSMKEDRV